MRLTLLGLLPAVSSWVLPNIDLSQLVLQNISPNTIPSIREVLKNSSIIPEVLDDFEPLYHIDLTYRKHHHDHQVLLGNDIKPKYVKKKPVITIQPIIPQPNPPSPGSPLHHNEDNNEKVYTLILTDPDAKSRSNPKWSEMCHWILTNLTAPLPLTTTAITSSNLNIHHSTDLVSYKPPAPPKKTGPHRYVFVLLEGTYNQTASLTPPKERQHWGYGAVRHGVRDWAEEKGLKVVGANFFYARHKKQ